MEVFNIKSEKDVIPPIERVEIKCEKDEDFSLDISSKTNIELEELEIKSENEEFTCISFDNQNDNWHIEDLLHNAQVDGNVKLFQNLEEEVASVEQGLVQCDNCGEECSSPSTCCKSCGKSFSPNEKQNEYIVDVEKINLAHSHNTRIAQEELGCHSIFDKSHEEETISEELQVKKPRKSKQCRTCKQCGKTFERKYDHDIHVKVHMGIRPFACEVCFKTFTRRYFLIEHNKIHSGERLFFCHLCPKSFLQKSKLNRHHKIHSGEKPFQCQFCQRSFARKHNMMCHERIHTGEKLFYCTICDKAYTRSKNLNIHLKTHETQVFKCGVCGVTKDNKLDYTWHLKIHGKITQFECEVCRKSFKKKSLLKKHKRIHSNLKDYHCSFCTSSFANSFNLNRHMKSHHPKVVDGVNCDTTKE